MGAHPLPSGNTSNSPLLTYNQSSAWEALIRRTLFALLVCLTFSGSACLSVREARLKYAATQNYSALKALSRRLEIGMTRAEVEALLGKPLDHPGNGQYCYLSDRAESAGTFAVPVGLIVNYCDGEGRETDRLASFYFVAVAE